MGIGETQRQRSNVALPFPVVIPDFTGASSGPLRNEKRSYGNKSGGAVNHAAAFPIPDSRL